MPNQISKEKKQISMLIPKKLLAMTDREAELKNCSRTDIVIKALREHHNLDPINASASQVEVLQEKINLLRHDIGKLLPENSENIQHNQELLLNQEKPEKKSKWQRILDVLKD